MRSSEAVYFSALAAIALFMFWIAVSALMGGDCAMCLPR